MKHTNVYVVGKSTNYANWIPNCKLVANMKEADLVIFTGGEDVSPSVYNEPQGSKTSSNIFRDMEEIKAFEEARSLDKPMLGICRGSQLLCVLSNGRLVQHQQNPGYIHPIHTHDGQTIPITSTHHQAQYPYELPQDEYKLLAWTEGLSKMHLDGKDMEISNKPFKEAEIVYYPKTRALGIQGHPEDMYDARKRYEKTFSYLTDLVDGLLNNKL